MIDDSPGPYTHEDTWPRLWDWDELKAVVDSGDLGNLKRHPSFQAAYDTWTVGIVQQHGSMVDFLIKTRLHWDLSTPLETYLSPDSPPYFTSDIPDQLVKVVLNDWPYSVPPGVTHFLIWSRLPFTHDALVPPRLQARIAHDGLWGFTGGTPPVPRHALSLQEKEDQESIKAIASHTDTFIQSVWKPEEWETAWFCNPRRLQSVPGLAHVHVFARKK